jgi:hypothetical protein
VSLSRAPVILLVAFLLAGCSVERLPVPSAPLVSADPSEPATSIDPEPAFAGLPAIDHRVLATIDRNGRSLFGTLADGWQSLDVLPSGATTVVDTWGRIAVTALDDGEIVVSTPSVEGLSMLYRTADGADATTSTSYTADGKGMVVFNVSLGVRHVDLTTGQATDVFPPEAFFAGDTTVGDVHWSPTGRLLVFVVCDMETCHSLVADSLKRTEVVDDFVPGAIAGRWLVGYERDGDRAPLLVDFESGERRRVAPAIDRLWTAMAVSESRFLLWGTSGREFAFVLLDLSDGTDRLLAKGVRTWTPIPQLSTADWAILKALDSDVGVPVGGTLSVLDFASGRIIEDVIQVPPAP